MTARTLESEDSYAPYRAFDPERNQAEIRKLYGDDHADRVTDWDIILERVGKDTRDKRDPRKIGRAILRRVAKRND